jgi:NAD(P)H-nitrite reductase large subunit
VRGVAVTSAGASCGSCCTDLSEVSFLFDWQDDINSKAIPAATERNKWWAFSFMFS